ncbi:MAG: gamma-glutamylcyclotransferase family protein [Candidatus Rhabdochlamydia sp.]
MLLFLITDLRAETPPWGANKHILLVEHVQKLEKDLKKYPSFPFPILAEEVFKLFPNQRIPIFAYGSLLHPESALKTIPQTTIDTYRLVVAYGFQRAFNYKATPSKKISRKSDVAMLNLFQTKSSNIVNGVLIWVTHDDLAKLIQREKGYHLKPVILSDWNQDSEISLPNFWFAYVFIAPSDSSYSHPKINPYPPYANAVLLGAKRYGDLFFTFWLETTFLADLITPFSAWIENPQIDCNRGKPSK